jgi:LEA14-like dessication related protein
MSAQRRVVRYGTGMRLVSACLAAALAVACSKPSPPTITADRATVTSVDAQSIHFDVALTAANPNAVDLTVSDVKAHVVLDKRVDLGTFTLPKAVTLPAGKSTAIDAPVSLQWTDLASLAQLATSKTNVPFTVDGTVELGEALLHVSVPFQLTGTISPQQLAGTVLRGLPALPR